MQKRNITTKEQAREYAIDWQNWASEQNLSYDEIIAWQCHFGAIASRYNLIEEFKENGII